MPGVVPELEAYRDQFRAARIEANRLCAGLNSAQANWRPGVERWSVAECLIHLTVSARIYCALIRPVVAQAHARGLLGTGPFRYGIISRWLLRSVEPPVRGRTKTPRRFQPPDGVVHGIANTLAEFVAVGVEWEECLNAANGLDLAQVRVPSPVVPWLRFRLGALFAGQAAHERRHLWQARRVLTASGFPSAS